MDTSQGSLFGSGCQTKGAERYIVEFGSIPWRIDSVSTNVMKEEPDCRRPCAARLNWRFLRPGATAVMARMAPLRGLIDTIADAGSPFSVSVFLIAATAAFWNFGLIVV